VINFSDAPAVVDWSATENWHILSTNEVARHDAARFWRHEWLKAGGPTYRSAAGSRASARESGVVPRSM